MPGGALLRVLVDVEGSGDAKALFIWTRLDESGLHLKASDGHLTWEGEVSNERLQAMASDCKMTFHSFMEETQTALSGQQTHDLMFVYSMKSLDNTGIQLAWKKLLPIDQIRFQLGTIDLFSVPDQSIHAFLLSRSIENENTLAKKIQELEDRCANLEAERRAALDELCHQCSLQEELEKSLYGKFKLILNEKKFKIRKLMEQKEHLVEQNEEMQRQVWNTKGNSSAHTSTEKEAKECFESATMGEIAGIPPDSLLCDTSRPPSPPPLAKRQQIRKSKVEIPRPPKLQTERVNRDGVQMTTDSNELLDML